MEKWIKQKHHPEQERYNEMKFFAGKHDITYIHKPASNNKGTLP